MDIKGELTKNQIRRHAEKAADPTFFVHWGFGRTSLCSSVALLGWGIPWYPRIQNLVKMWLRRDSNPCTQEKEPWSKKWIEMQQHSPVRYRLDHLGQLLVMVVLVVCIRAHWVIHTPVSVHCSTGLGYTQGYRGIPQPSGAMGAKSRVCPEAPWAEKLDRVRCVMRSVC